MKIRKSVQRGITLLLVLAVTLNLILVSFADYANHPTHPTLTNNTTVCQVGQTTKTLTFEQEAVWTNEAAGEAAVKLSFDGAQYVKEELKPYDFALFFDGSYSSRGTGSKSALKSFVQNILSQNPDARFTLILNRVDLPVYLDNSNNESEIFSQIDAIPVSGQNANVDFIVPSIEKAYDLHKATQRSTSLMCISITDGDWAYTPAAWSANRPFTFSTMYHGSQYEVTVDTTNTYSYGSPCVYNNQTYYAGYGTAEGMSESRGTYTIKKDGVVQSISNNNVKAAWAHALYLFYRAETVGMRNDGLALATICVGQLPYTSYPVLISNRPNNIKAQLGADKGLSFALSGDSTADFTSAFNGLEATMKIKVVTMNTSVDNRYFTVNETALANSLPEGCTYTLTSATKDGVPVQTVQVVYTISDSQLTMETVFVPVTINANIPAADFLANDKYLPVVYDSANGNEMASCLFTDLNNTVQNIKTRRVFLDASTFAPNAFTVSYDANGGAPTPASQLKFYGVPLTLTTEVPVKSGYTFKGWATNQTATTAEYTSGGSYTADSGDVTLYAVWTPTSDLYDVQMDTDSIILLGHWANEGTGYISFWISFDGGALTTAELDYLTASAGRHQYWDTVLKNIHTFGAASITGSTKTVGTAVYSEVKVPVNVFDSGISTLSLVCDGVNLATAYVITPGDVVTEFGVVNASDMAQIARVVNTVNGTPEPLPGLANDFAYEMMDMTRDGVINASDMGALARIVNSITHY